MKWGGPGAAPLASHLCSELDPQHLLDDEVNLLLETQKTL
jgi:hypothetical protein